MTDDQPSIDELQRVTRYIAKMADTIGYLAGTGGMETAGQIVSYIANHPDQAATLMQSGIVDLPNFVRGGCLSWHGMNGKIVHPSELQELLDDEPEAAP